MSDRGFTPRARIGVVGGLVCLGFTVLGARLFAIQVLHGKSYYRERIEQSEGSVPIPAERGNIYDRTLAPLALSYRATSVAVRPRAVSDVRTVEAGLLEIGGLDPHSVRTKVRSNRSFEWVIRRARIEEPLLSRLLRLEGVELLSEPARVYPLGDQAAALVGATNVDNRGAFGLEASFDAILSGRPGRMRILRTATNRALPDPEVDVIQPVPGQNLVLTLDAAVQTIVEYELGRGLREYGAKHAIALFARPATGEILALAEVPAPSRKATADPAAWNLRSVTGLYEPGSTFKLLTAACLLEEGMVDPGQIFFGENGTADFGSFVIRDPHPFGWLTFRDAFVKSSNICMAKASEVLTDKEFYRFLRDFGFGSATGIAFAAESPGSLKHYDDWSGRTRATISFGYEIGVTPLQMVAAYGALANGGYWVAPRIVRAIVDGRGRVVQDYGRTPRRRVLSKRTVAILKEFCLEVVNEGTGTNAAVPGLEVCGKTGTAHKLGKAGRYDDRRHIASFIGFAPKEAPEIVGIVLYDEPRHEKRWGGSSAAPTFGRILAAIGSSSDHLGWGERVRIAPSEAGEETVPDFLNLVPSDAAALARNAGIRIETEGSGGRILAQVPAPGVTCSASPVVRLQALPPPTSPKRPQAVRVPDLRGLTTRAAKRLLASLGLRMGLEGSGLVQGQTPAAGGRMVPGRRVHVVCTPARAWSRPGSHPSGRKRS